MGSTDNGCTEFKLRRFTVDDYDALIKLWQLAGLQFKPSGRDRKENLCRELDHGNGIFLIADNNGKIIGSAFGTHDGRKGWINRVAVDPRFQRHGIATRLVRELEEHFEAMGIGIIACLIETWNKESIIFFEKSGYKRHDDIAYFTKRRHPEV